MSKKATEKEKQRQYRQLFREIEQTTAGLPRLGDAADIKRGEIKEPVTRPYGICIVSEECVKNVMIHEQPGYAESCKKCDAYQGKK